MISLLLIISKVAQDECLNILLGMVYLFNNPPQEELPLVDIPIFSQDESNTTDSLLIQLDKDDMTIESWKRVQKYHNQSILSIDTLRGNSGINPDYQMELAMIFIKLIEVF